jgi:hypothetical protein
MNPLEVQFDKHKLRPVELEYLISVRGLRELSNLEIVFLILKYLHCERLIKITSDLEVIPEVSPKLVIANLYENTILHFINFKFSSGEKINDLKDALKDNMRKNGIIDKSEYEISLYGLKRIVSMEKFMKEPIASLKSYTEIKGTCSELDLYFAVSKNLRTCFHFFASRCRGEEVTFDDYNILWNFARKLTFDI